MAIVPCPACTTRFEVADRLMLPGNAVRCPECGTKMRLERKSTASGDDKVLFPNVKADETLLELGEAVKQVRRAAPSKVGRGRRKKR